MESFELTLQVLFFIISPLAIVYITAYTALSNRKLQNKLTEILQSIN